MAKKIMALVMAIALVVCFAVSASAEVNVFTTTEYVTVENEQQIKVNVTVTATEEEFADGDNVTYYATASDGEVHIDQVEVADGKAEFKFNVADGKLGSAVKVGYTGASGATDANITGYTVTLDNAQSQVIPTGATKVSFNYTATADMEFEKVTADGNVEGLGCSLDGTTINVTFTKISGNVNFTLHEKPETVQTTVNPQFLAHGAVLVKKNTDYSAGIKQDAYYGDNGEDIVDPNYNADEEGNRKLTVIGQVAQESTDFGIIISTSEIADKQYTEVEFNALNTASTKTFAALNKNDEGKFAVQIIDTNNEATADLIKADTPYYTAVYAKDASGVYEVHTSGTSTVMAAAATNEN